MNPVDYKIREGAFKAKFPKVMSSVQGPPSSIRHDVPHAPLGYESNTLAGLQTAQISREAHSPSKLHLHDRGVLPSQVLGGDVSGIVEDSKAAEVNSQ